MLAKSLFATPWLASLLATMHLFSHEERSQFRLFRVGRLSRDVRNNFRVFNPENDMSMVTVKSLHLISGNMMFDHTKNSFVFSCAGVSIFRFDNCLRYLGEI